MAKQALEKQRRSHRHWHLSGLRSHPSSLSVKISQKRAELLSFVYSRESPKPEWRSVGNLECQPQLVRVRHSPASCFGGVRRGLGESRSFTTTHCSRLSPLGFLISWCHLRRSDEKSLCFQARVIMMGDLMESFIFHHQPIITRSAFHGPWVTLGMTLSPLSAETQESNNTQNSVEHQTLSF